MRVPLRVSGSAVAFGLALSLPLAAALPASATAAQRSPFILGTAAVAKGAPIAGGRVMAESLTGAPLTIRWGRYGAFRTTKANGSFAFPRAGLPSRFVVVVRGGRALGARRTSTFRAVYQYNAARPQTAQVSLGTTLQVSAYRNPTRTTPNPLRTARAKVIRALRLPGNVTLGLDDRVNPQYIAAGQVRRAAAKQGGLTGLIDYLSGLVIKRGVIARPGLGTKVTAPDFLDLETPCDLETFVADPSSLAFCSLAEGLSVVSTPSDADQLAEISAQLGQLQTEVSQLQGALQTDFLTLMAANSVQAYNTAAAAPGATQANITAGIQALYNITAFSPGGPGAGTQGAQAIVRSAIRELKAYMSLTAPGGFANPATATLLNQQTVASGVAGLGTLPAAWQAIRAQQQTGSLGSTAPSGDAALGQGTTLFTNEMSSAFNVAANYWYSWMFQLAVMSANYWNYVYTATPPASTSRQQATANQLGGITCDQGPPCPNTIASYLQQQIFATPMTVPSATVIDPTTNLIWGTAIRSPIPGSNGLNPNSSDTGLPVNPSTGNPIVPELLNQLNTGAATPWNNVNAAVTAVARNIGASPSFTLDWGLPTANWAFPPQGPIFDGSQSPQFGMPGGGSGLLGGIQLQGNGQLNLQAISGITSPPAFPSTQSGGWWVQNSNVFLPPFCAPSPSQAWEGCNSFFYPLGLSYPSGTMTFMNNPVVSDGPKTGMGWMSVAPEPVVAPPLTGAVLVQSPVPANQFAYPATYPQSVLANSSQLINQIEAYR